VRVPAIAQDTLKIGARRAEFPYTQSIPYDSK
jgi:hypothetical protein